MASIQHTITICNIRKNFKQNIRHFNNDWIVMDTYTVACILGFHYFFCKYWSCVINLVLILTPAFFQGWGSINIDRSSSSFACLTGLLKALTTVLKTGWNIHSKLTIYLANYIEWSFLIVSICTFVSRNHTMVIYSRIQNLNFI